MEFGLIAVPICLMLFGIFDLGRYAITLHSLSTLSDETARQQIICYSPWIAVNNIAGAVCPSDPLGGSKLTLAPFLRGLIIHVTTTPKTDSSGAIVAHVVQAELQKGSGFKMILRFWPPSMDTPSTQISLPF